MSFFIVPCKHGCTHEPDMHALMPVFVKNVLNRFSIFELIFLLLILDLCSNAHLAPLCVKLPFCKATGTQQDRCEVKGWPYPQPPTPLHSPRPCCLASLCGPALPAAMVNKSLPDPTLQKQPVPAQADSIMNNN